MYTIVVHKWVFQRFLPYLWTQELEIQFLWNSPMDEGILNSFSWVGINSSKVCIGGVQHQEIRFSLYVWTYHNNGRRQKCCFFFSSSHTSLKTFAASLAGYTLKEVGWEVIIVLWHLALGFNSTRQEVGEVAGCRRGDCTVKDKRCIGSPETPQKSEMNLSNEYFSKIYPLVGFISKAISFVSDSMTVVQK